RPIRELLKRVLHDVAPRQRMANVAQPSPTARSRFNGRYWGGRRNEPNALALPKAYSHALDDEDLHLNVGLPHLFHPAIVRVGVPCLRLLERRKLQNDDCKGRLLSSFQGQKPRRKVPPDQRFAAVFYYESRRLREIFLDPCHPTRC